MPAPDGLWRIWFTFESPQYYPFTFTSLWLAYRLWGPDATSHFVVNVLLHAGNSVLFPSAELAQAMGVDSSTARRAVAAAINDGYLVNRETRPRQPYRLALGDRNLTDLAPILPTPAEVKAGKLKNDPAGE